MEYPSAQIELGDAYETYRSRFVNESFPIETRLYTAESLLNEVQKKKDEASIFARNQLAWDGLNLIMLDKLPKSPQWNFADVPSLHKAWKSFQSQASNAGIVRLAPMANMLLAALENDTPRDFEALSATYTQPFDSLDAYQSFLKRYQGYLVTDLPVAGDERKQEIKRRIAFFLDLLPSSERPPENDPDAMSNSLLDFFEAQLHAYVAQTLPAPVRSAQPA